VYTFTKLHDRLIRKVRVGVGPMEFQLNEHFRETTIQTALLASDATGDTPTDYRGAPPRQMFGISNMHMNTVSVAFVICIDVH